MKDAPAALIAEVLAETPALAESFQAVCALYLSAHADGIECGRREVLDMIGQRAAARIRKALPDARTE